MNKAEAIRLHLLSKTAITAITGQRIYKNQGNQADYDEEESYIVMAFRATPDECRSKDANSEMGVMVMEAYTLNYDTAEALGKELKTALDDAIILHNGYRYDMERLTEDFDKVTTETDGLVLKEFTINYHQNLAY